MTLATDQSAAAEDFSPKAIKFMTLRDEVMDHWEREVRVQIKGAGSLLSPVLTNMLPAFFDNIAETLSPNHPRKIATSDTNAAAAHGDERARMTRFGPDQIVHEYQIFRSAIRSVAKGRVELSEADNDLIDQSVNAATREAVRSFTSSQSEIRQKVAAALSHDMRTPLAIVANGAQLIGMTTDLAAVHRFATKIESGAARLGAMMNELLDALTSQGDVSFPIQLTHFDIVQLVDEAREQYGQDGECDIALEPHDAIPGYWCWNSLRRSLENLINNAIKYRDGGNVTIKVATARERLMLSVHNEGNPIAKDAQDRIFEYLRREGQSTQPGWGIGLQFVKTVAEAHGGSVAVDSSIETGTTFLVDIPIDCRPFVSA